MLLPLMILLVLLFLLVVVVSINVVVVGIVVNITSVVVDDDDVVSVVVNITSVVVDDDVVSVDNDDGGVLNVWGALSMNVEMLSPRHSAATMTTLKLPIHSPLCFPYAQRSL